jgi:translation initiation factor 1 (eIF-1/SUI1)
MRKNTEKDAMRTSGDLFGGVDKKKIEKPALDTKEEKESVNVRISKETRARLKAYCAVKGLKMGDVVAKLIEDFLKKQK